MADEPIQVGMALFDDARSICSLSSSRLASLAQAFYRTGNATVAKELYQLADDMAEAEKFIQSGASRCLDQYVGAVAGGSANMMNAIIAMAQIDDRKSLEN